ncbi:hypothetical protein AB1Y20_005537 [Prymnesium parvum]|uniref:NADP-dependent oxidoreductase domain-containing protein n=1 Tax=Prymnesium parvum TaxID=97485 RepID=A0AB34J6I4_PRYPA
MASRSSALPTLPLAGGVRMPVVALGTGGFDNASAASAVQLALAAGLTHVHTAFDYFNLPGVSRGLLASGLARPSYFLTGMTSPCVHPAAPPTRNITDPSLCLATTAAEARDALRLLGAHHFDLLLLHGPNARFGSTEPCGRAACALNAAQWRAYVSLLHAGVARAIGVSNYCASCLECLRTYQSSPVVMPAVNQIQLHVGSGADPEGLLSYCREHGIVVQAYSPLASGGVVRDALCRSIGAKHNRTSAQVGIRWIFQNEALAGNASIVVKASSSKYIQQDLAFSDWALDDADMKALNAADSPKGQQGGRPSWGCGS